MAGQTVECPACKKQIHIPLVIAEPTPPHLPFEPQDTPRIENRPDFNQGSSSSCQQCGNSMPTDAVLCVRCGFDKRTEKQTPTLTTFSPTSARTDVRQCPSCGCNRSQVVSLTETRRYCREREPYFMGCTRPRCCESCGYMWRPRPTRARSIFTIIQLVFASLGLLSLLITVVNIALGSLGSPLIFLPLLLAGVAFLGYRETLRTFLIHRNNLREM